MDDKQLAGVRAASYVEDGMVVGLGTGSTVRYAIETLAEQRNTEGLDIVGVATSQNTATLAESLGIPLVTLADVTSIDVTIDGADEVDGELNGIKGGGGALLFEKIVATASQRNIWVVDSGKQVETLGAFPLPVEVIPFACPAVMRTLQSAGMAAHVRQHDRGDFLTDSGNQIIDIQLNDVTNAGHLNVWLNMLPGVVENGLFLDIADGIVVGRDGQVDVIEA